MRILLKPYQILKSITKQKKRNMELLYNYTPVNANIRLQDTVFENYNMIPLLILCFQNEKEKIIEFPVSECTESTQKLYEFVKEMYSKYIPYIPYHKINILPNSEENSLVSIPHRGDILVGFKWNGENNVIFECVNTFSKNEKIALSYHIKYKITMLEYSDWVPIDFMKIRIISQTGSYIKWSKKDLRLYIGYLNPELRDKIRGSYYSPLDISD